MYKSFSMELAGRTLTVDIGRENTASKVCTLAELRERQVNMFTTVFIGNSRTKIIGGKLVTPRGYVLPDPAV